MKLPIKTIFASDFTAKPAFCTVVSRFLQTVCALSALGLAPCAQSAVIYSGIKNIAIPNDLGGVYIDLESGASGTATAPADWDINPYGETELNLYYGGDSSTGTFADTNDTTLLVRTHVLNDPISTITFTPPPDGFSYLHEFDPGPAGERFIGLRRDAGGGNFQFGWLRYSYDTSNSWADMKVVDWAFETSNNQQILTGAGIPVPEPAGAALLAAGALAVVRRRRLA